MKLMNRNMNDQRSSDTDLQPGQSAPNTEMHAVDASESFTGDGIFKTSEQLGEKKFSRLLKPVGYMLIFALGIAVYLNAQQISDWWTLRNYVPLEAISNLSKSASFTNEAQKLFYVNDPELLSEEAFSQNCQSDEQTIILGCYVDNSKIYVFDVSDDRIDGVEEVTAAHEMLHAAYSRLSEKQQIKIDMLSSQELARLKDPRILKTIESYRERDSSVVAGELHSILGTEVRILSKELEEYYSQYFVDRIAVVSLSEKYSAEFTSRELKIEEYDAQLTVLNQEIKDAEISISALADSVDSERSRINSLVSQPSVYNSAIPGFNALVSRYNNELQALRKKIDQYNTIVSERNSIALEENELFEAIDSRIPEASLSE